MQEHIFNGFRSEMEKEAFIGKTIGTLAKGAWKILKPAAKIVKKNPMNTAFVGMGVHGGVSKTTGILPKFSKVPGS